MPIVKSDAVLAEIYKAVQAKIENIPTQLLMPGQIIYRSISPSSRYTLLQKPPKGGRLSKAALDSLLKPPSGSLELRARYSGPSSGALKPEASGNTKAIQGVGGVYFSLQTQALVNEMMHYRQRPGDKVFNGRAILHTVLQAPMLVADLSPHNPGAVPFVKSIGKDVYEQMANPIDCSVARGIGLAVANSGKFSALVVQTARTSERSDEELGDNMVIFGTAKRPLPMLRVQSVQFYDQYSKEVEMVPVDWA